MASFESEYEQARAALFDGPMAEDRVDLLLEEWAEQITEATAEAADAHRDALRVDAWRSELDVLRRQLDHARGG